MLCATCDRPIPESRPRSSFCSKKCKDKKLKTQRIVISCTSCQIVYELSYASWHKRKDKAELCGPCSRALTVDNSGEKNPRWKGGHRHYSPGRFGKDKDGLSWKTQRKLAWERDDYTCQHCGLKPNRRKPDVHHIIPWPASLSHNLANLICLCRKCHSIEDGKCHDKWGGQLVERPPKPQKVKKEKRVKSQIPKIKKEPKRRSITDKQLALELQNQGWSLAQIASHFGVSRQAVYYWNNSRTIPR